jgi:hypothetical protein
MNIGDGNKRVKIQGKRKSLLLERAKAQDERKALDKERANLLSCSPTSDADVLENLRTLVELLQEQVRSLQIQTDMQRDELNILKRQIGIVSDKKQAQEETAVKRRENWQTFYEAAQTLKEDQQDMKEAPIRRKSADS